MVTRILVRTRMDYTKRFMDMAYYNITWQPRDIHNIARQYGLSPEAIIDTQAKLCNILN